MDYFYDTVTNTRGDSLVGYRARLKTLDGSTAVTIYADENGTPIANVSGIANTAVTDNTGFFGFWTFPGSYTLEVLNGAGALFKTIRGVTVGGTGVTPPPETDIDDGTWDPNGAVIDDGDWSPGFSNIIDDGVWG